MSVNVLVVEDESIVRKDIEQTLKGLGYQVVSTVDNGEDAIEAASKYRPDVILMDIMLKGDLNGIAAAEEIKRTVDVPILFLTAYADRGTLSEAKLAEPHGYILKPFKDVDLQTGVEMALHKFGKEQEAKMENDFLRSVAEHKESAEYIFVKHRSKLVKVDINDLLFIEALKDYVVVHTPEHSYTIHSTMKDVEHKLNERRFMRVHRSYIVNLDAVESIKYSMIHVRDMEKEIPVGGSYKDALAGRINLL
jgi:DNA-binding LytR/AlgR family response regulator